MAVKVKFNAKALRRELYNRYVPMQTKLLVDYAKQKVVEIGDTFLTSDTINNLDRTGNLLDSLCWGVALDGKIKDSGFYRKQKAQEQSSLHKWFVGDVSSLFPVYGHGLAQKYIDNFSSTHSEKGWIVFFAVLAPYWGYWEKGFTMRSASGDRHLRLAIMTQHYDEIKSDLKPAKVTLRIGVPKYTYMGLHSLVKQTQNPRKEKRHFNQFPEFKKPRRKK